MNFKRAFTLIEVLVALAIIALLMPVILYSLSLESRLAASARNRTQASSLATQKLNQIVADFPTDGLAQNSGDFTDQDPQYARFHWTAALSDYPSATVDGVNTFLQQLDLTVTWKESGQDRTLQLSTLLYQNQTTTSGLPGGLPGGL